MTFPDKPMKPSDGTKEPDGSTNNQGESKDASGPSNPRIVASTISLGTFSVINSALGLIGTIILARYLAPQDYGILILISVLVTFLSQISTFGLETAVPWFIAGSTGESSKERYFGTAIVLRLVTIVVTSLVAWFGGPWLRMLFGQSLLPQYIIYVPFLFALDSLRALLRSTLQGYLLFVRMGVTDSILSFSKLVFYAILIFVIHPPLYGFLIASSLSTILACLYAILSIPIRKKIAFQVEALKELIRFGYPLQVNDILHFIYSRIDTVAVAAFLGPADIALYEVARKIPDNLRSFFDPFSSVYYPFIAKRYQLQGRQNASPFLNDAVRFVAFVTLLGTAIAVLFGRDILQLVFTNKYSAAAPFFVILMLNLSVALVSNVMGTTLVATGDSQKPMIINVFNAIASWAGSLLLVPKFGLMGAAVANTVGTLVAYPLNRFFLRRRIDLKDAPYLKPFILFTAWGVLVYIINPGSFLMKVALLIVFLAASAILSIITKQDIQLLFESSGLESRFPFKNLVLWVSKL